MRPGILTAIDTEWPNVGTITLCARDRRAGFDLRRQTRECDKTSRCDRSNGDC
jgi:hypothetical protein